MKLLKFVGSALKDLSAMPDGVKLDFGYQLYKAQQLGEFPTTAKPLKGFGGASVIELRENFCGDTYRAVYTVKFENTIYVLHCFKKKSNYGIATPQVDIELIKKRLQAAIEMELINKKDK